jgi:hypothetical protein
MPILLTRIINSIFHVQKKLLGKKLYKHYIEYKEKKIVQSFDKKYTVLYGTSTETLFAELCDKYGSDKGSLRNSSPFYWWPSHTYADYYSSLFAHCRNKVFNVFECGIGTNNPNLKSNMTINGRPGASLRVWRDYFPKANIIGVDIDKEILFKEERIETFVLDQTNEKSISNFWDKVEVNEFDLMVDDGLHKFSAGIKLFKNSVHRLASGGVYIIEDVNLHDLLSYREWFKTKNEYVVDYVLMSNLNRSADGNSLISIRKATL